MKSFVTSLLFVLLNSQILIAATTPINVDTSSSNKSFSLLSPKEIQLHQEKMKAMSSTEKNTYRDQQYKLLKQKAFTAGYRLPTQSPWNQRKLALAKKQQLNERRNEINHSLGQQKRGFQAIPKPSSKLIDKAKKQMQAYREMMRARFAQHQHGIEQQRNNINSYRKAQRLEAKRLMEQHPFQAMRPPQAYYPLQPLR